MATPKATAVEHHTDSKRCDINNARCDVTTFSARETAQGSNQPTFIEHGVNPVQRCAESGIARLLEGFPLL